MMNCPYEPQIDDVVDRRLSADEAAVFEAHLPGCAACSTILADLRTIRSTARVLERHAPPAHVWARIHKGISEQQPPQQAWSLFAKRASGWPPLAVAAMLVLLVGSAAWFGWRTMNTTPPAQQAAGTPNSNSPDPALIQSVETQLKLAEEHYSNAIAGLDAIAKAEDTALDPETAEVLQANLAVIDTAIGESRAALTAEPGNTLAQDSLFSALQSKVTLLQDTIALINEMRKGNEEGAARIVSEMNP